MEFCVPDGWEYFSRKVFQKYESLIQLNIIEHISRTKFNCWTRQFVSPEEKYLAAHLLDSLTYRTQKMNEAVYEHIFYVTLPGVLLKKKIDIDDLHNSLQYTKSVKMKFIPVTDGVSACKSSDTYLREFRRKNIIKQFYLTTADRIVSFGDEIDVIVFFDDFVGTGKQFTKFYSKHNLGEIQDKKLIYIPLIAHERGLNEINEKCSNICVNAVETITDEQSFFSPATATSDLWGKDRSNSVEAVKQFYIGFLKSKGIGNGKNFGNGQLALTLAFSSSSPNNTLNVFHSTQNNWQSLFTR